MNIPNLYTGTQVNEDGMLSAEAHQQFDQLFSELQNNLSNEGFMIPQQDTDTITSLNHDKSKSALLYNQNHNEFNGNVNGTFKTIPTVNYNPTSKVLTFTVNGELVTLQGT